MLWLPVQQFAESAGKEAARARERGGERGGAGVDRGRTGVAVEVRRACALAADWETRGVERAFERSRAWVFEWVCGIC